MPLVATQIRVQILTGTRRQDQIHRLPENLLKMEVQRPGRPVEVDVGVEIQSRVQKTAERRDARLVERQPFPGKKGVEAQTDNVHDIQGKTGHEGVPLDVIEIVHRVGAREELTEQLKPSGPLVIRSRHADQKGHLGGIEGLSVGKRSRRAPPDSRDHPPQLPADDHPPQILMGQTVLAQEVVVEKMAVRAMTDIVKKAGHPEKLLHAVRGGGIGADLLQGRVEVAAELAGHVHRSEGMLEPRVFGRGIDPAGALELEDAPEALHPGRVDQVLFGFFAVVGGGNGEGGIPVNGVCNQRHPLIGSRIFGRLPFHGCTIYNIPA